MEVLAKSKGGNVSDRLKEAGGNAVSRRTETSYKAERLGKAAQHVEALDSSRTVNDDSASRYVKPFAMPAVGKATGTCPRQLPAESD